MGSSLIIVPVFVLLGLGTSGLFGHDNLRKVRVNYEAIG